MERKDAVDSLLLLCQAIPLHDQNDNFDNVVNKSNVERNKQRVKFENNGLLPISSGNGKQYPGKIKNTKQNNMINIRKLKDRKYQLLNHSVENNSGHEACHTTVDGKNNSYSKVVKLESIPFFIFGAFNSGDKASLRDILDSITVENVSFKTDSLKVSRLGRQNFMKFFKALEDVCPDAFIISNNVKVINNHTMTASVYIKGTKVLPSQYEHYVMKPRLVDNMNLKLLKSEELSKLRELEFVLISQNKPIEIEFVGNVTFTFESSLDRGNDDKVVEVVKNGNGITSECSVNPSYKTSVPPLAARNAMSSHLSVDGVVGDKTVLSRPLASSSTGSSSEPSSFSCLSQSMHLPSKKRKIQGNGPHVDTSTTANPHCLGITESPSVNSSDCAESICPSLTPSTESTLQLSSQPSATATASNNSSSICMSKICEISFSYQLKSFREAVIMPA